MRRVENATSRRRKAKPVFSGFHTNGQKKADAEQFRWKMYLVRRVLGLLAAGRGERSQVYGHCKGRNRGWSLRGCGPRVRCGSVLLRNARLAALTSVIPDKSRRYEYPRQRDQRSCRYFNPPEENRHS